MLLAWNVSLLAIKVSGSGSASRSNGLTERSVSPALVLDSQDCISEREFLTVFQENDS